MAEVPMTELEAVNVMLGSIGEAPVDTLDVTGVVEVSIAQVMLNNISRSVQARGWWFNTDTEYPMVPDSSGNIVLSPAMMAVDTSNRSSHYDVVERNRMLYDRKNHTFIFTETLYCDVTWMFPFTQLPHAARWYITLLAARKFHDSLVGDQVLHTFTQDDVDLAFAEMNAADVAAEDGNMLSSYETSAIAQRHFNP